MATGGVAVSGGLYAETVENYIRHCFRTCVLDYCIGSNKACVHAFFAPKSLSWVVNKHAGKLFLSLFCIRLKVKGRGWS